MIRKWQVGNFKSIRDQTELAIAPLTVFAGDHNSGKSSFIQSILLVAQSLDGYSFGQNFTLNGNYVELGRFKDIKSDGCEDSLIAIKFNCGPLPKRDQELNQNQEFSEGKSLSESGPSQIQEIECQLTFGVHPGDGDCNLQSCHPEITCSELNCIGWDAENSQHTARRSIRVAAKPKRKHGDTIVEYNRNERQFGMTNNVILDDGSLAEATEKFHSVNPVGCKMKHFLPTDILMPVDSIDEYAKLVAETLLSCLPSSNHCKSEWNSRIGLHEEIVELLLEVANDREVEKAVKERRKSSLCSLTPLDIDLWFEILDSLPEHKKKEVANKIQKCEDFHDQIRLCLQKAMKFKPKVACLNPPELIADSVKYIEDFFTDSIRYLGMLDESPKPMHPLARSKFDNEDEFQTDHTESFYKQHKGDIVRYVPTESFNNPAVERKIVADTLESAVSDWIGYLGIANSVEFNPSRYCSHELMIGFSDSNMIHALRRLGTGVSQVLTILVAGLSANSDSTLIFEHPELHLHPKVQSLLGDFFLSLVFCDKQCIVETHSECMIDRLRYRIATSPPDNELLSLVRVYFVEKSSKVSSFKEVMINRFGAITDRPKGFFEESHKLAADILKFANRKQALVQEVKNE